MKEIGKVIEILEYDAKIVIFRNTACGDCGACQVGKDNLNMILNLPNKIGAKYGDSVEIELKTNNFYLAAMIAYGIPLIALFSGMVIAYYAMIYLVQSSSQTAELVAAVSGLSATAITFLLIRANEGRIKQMKKFTPEMVRIIN